ncbi:ribbon-helix-helix protein, CopG family [Methylobacterium sp. 37f]|uniref:ribbon-helix-helix protein, CopG family n=1 Tax=Methylobacterium sp. 37f TaxID=2817058 RepID=UPI001FFCA358|nr:ribbon-helix-helix protein, CopG family [Methylobacterium sp. 37f]MCK2056921.1 hypothetical protein [Methylobacterium sp. 37f]
MSLPELPAPSFTDGRGLYPERLSASVPRGLTDLVKAAASAEGVATSEFIRRAIAARVSMFQYAATLNESE